MKKPRGRGKQFTEGNPGRQKGAKNKKTLQWEAFSNYCLVGGLQKFEEELNKLEGKDFVNSFTALLEFHKPKLARTELMGEVGLKATISETTQFNLKKKG